MRCRLIEVLRALEGLDAQKAVDILDLAKTCTLKLDPVTREVRDLAKKISALPGSPRRFREQVISAAEELLRMQHHGFRKIDAIKRIRADHGLSLKDAKDICDLLDWNSETT